MFSIPQYIAGVDIVPIIPYAAIACVIGFILLIVPGLIWIERVVIALMQDRLGPNRVGPRGLLQTIADGIKLFFKEDIEPQAVDRRIYYLAPVISMIPALAAGAAIPFGSVSVRMGDGSVVPLPLVAGNVNIGLLYILALSSLQVYGIVLGGWSSNNKYSLLGGLRSSAQMISYELAMSLAILTGVLLSGSLNLVDIVHSQGGYWLGFIPRWNVFQFFPLGFIVTTIYLVAMIAETNRAPFDLPEAESELIAGFHTEYSSMKFAMFFMGEYASMLVVSGLATTLWFGGWLPILPVAPFTWIPGVVTFLMKLMLFILVYVWLRASLPRLRYDALMNLGWKRMLPIALVSLLLVATLDTFFPRVPQASEAKAGASQPSGAIRTPRDVAAPESGAPRETSASAPGASSPAAGEETPSNTRGRLAPGDESPSGTATGGPTPPASAGAAAPGEGQPAPPNPGGATQ